VVPEAFVAATLGPQSQKSGDKSPGSRAKQISLLREQLIKAREYAEKAAKSEKQDTQEKPNDLPPRDLRLETLARVLRKELPLLVTANQSQDIASVVRLAEEFDLRMVLDSASEAYLHAELLKEKNIGVILHPTMARAHGELENKSFETAGLLRKGGVRVAIQGGYESYVPKARVVLFEAGYAAAHGAGFDGALATITIDAAKILGVDHRVGSLRVGLDGDVALFDGDPFEYTTHCTGVVIGGVPCPTPGR
jgi:imidazolonepropionase-like amidohydrolase